MKLNYTISLADFKAAQRLHRRQKLSRRISFVLLYIVLPAVAVLGWLCWPLLNITSDTPVAVSLGLSILDVVLLSFAATLPISREYETRKGFKRLFEAAHGNRNSFVEIDDEHILYDIPGVSESKLSWNAIIDFARDEKVTLFYVSKQAFIVLRTPDLSPEQMIEINDLVARHVVKKNP